MALGTKWQTRVSSAVAISLTNPDSQGQTTVDTDRLAAAVADVGADFQTFAQQTYDDDNARHVAIACMGVTAYLQSYGAASVSDADRSLTRFREALRQLWRTTAAARRLPATNSPFTRTDEGTNRTTVRPDFDVENFDGLIMDQPNRSLDGEGRLDNG